MTMTQQQQHASTHAHGRTFLTPRDLAARWGCSEGWLANERSKQRGVTFYKFGSAVRYDLADVETYESASRVHIVPSYAVGTGRHSPPL